MSTAPPTTRCAWWRGRPPPAPRGTCRAPPRGPPAPSKAPPPPVHLLPPPRLSTPARAVSCGIDLDTFTPHRVRAAKALFGLPDRPTIGFVGRLDTDKHLDDVITALREIRRRVDAQFVIA